MGVGLVLIWSIFRKNEIILEKRWYVIFSMFFKKFFKRRGYGSSGGGNGRERFFF